MSRAPRLDDILTALEGATRAYMQELEHVDTLAPDERLQFVTLGRDILEIEARTQKLLVEMRRKVR